MTLINTYFQKLCKESEISKVQIRGLAPNEQMNIEKEIIELKKAVPLGAAFFVFLCMELIENVFWEFCQKLIDKY